MSIARLSAGAGYRYLTKSVACADTTRGGADLTGYYTASGNPPGRWYGAGLAGLGAAGTDAPGLSTPRLVAGAVVTEEAMARLFGAGRDPLTGDPLGRGYPTLAPLADRVARRVASLPDGMDSQAHQLLVADIERVEAARRPRAAVAGFDLTFSARKSISVLWALGDEATRQAVYDAHRHALADVLAYAEHAAVFTRTGAGGTVQAPTRGIVAAAFDHWDTRTGDPQLHTHVVIANKVQGLDGVWRSLDSKALHHAVVTLSELYDNLLADHLTARLPVAFESRSRGPRRSPGFELDGIDDRLLAAFSTRTVDIDAVFREQVSAFTAREGRAPTRVEVTRLRQVATLASRPVKRGKRLADQLREWADRAQVALGLSPRQITAAALAHDPAVRLRHDQVSPLAVSRLAGIVLEQVGERASVFHEWQIRAEVHRVTRGLRMASAGDRQALADRVTAAVTPLAVRLTPAEPAAHTPSRTVVEDGPATPTATATRAGMTLYTHPELLAAETRLLETHLHDHDAATVPGELASSTARAPRPARMAGAARVRLAGDQVAAVVQACTSGRRIDVLVGPAGTGKTTTLLALREAWETTHGRGSVVGLAPSATAAAELAAAVGIDCENTAKWLHESVGVGAAHRAAIREGLATKRAHLAAVAAEPSATDRLDDQIRALDSEQDAWSMQPQQLVVVDEASLAGTRALDALRAQAVTAGAKLLLVGDPHQLASVEAGGVFDLLTARGRPTELVSLWRFTHRWEAHATRRLRHGDPAALAAYAAHGRLHIATDTPASGAAALAGVAAGVGDAAGFGGDRDVLLEQAYAAWQADTDTGAASLLVAADGDTVTALNARAHADRLATGQVTGPVVPLGDLGCGGHRGDAAAGDLILTRRNDRHLRLPDGGHVRNGALWTVHEVHPDGSLTVTPAHRHEPADTATASAASTAASGPEAGQGDERVLVRLPSEYVAEHVDLGYATTAHRAQGVTADTAHVLAAPGMTREALYVAMTRGRHANHLYVSTETPDSDCHPDTGGSVRSPVETLQRILATRGNPTSATQVAADLRAAAPPARATDRVTGPVTPTAPGSALRRLAADPVQQPSHSRGATR